MAVLETLGGLPQTEILVIPIIDVSGSMAGEKIASVNEAMRAVPQQLADINEDMADTKLKIAPMEFSSGARWFALQNNEPAEVESFRWIDMKASGLTDLGAACSLLAQKLTVTENGGWMKGRGGAAPVIILLSDGDPTDDYKKNLEILKKRGWFRSAIKFAVAIGADANKAVLAEFAGHSEAVIESEKVRTDLASLVKALIVSASSTASNNVSSNNNANNNAVVDDNTGDQQDEEIIQDVIDGMEKEIRLDNADDLF
jgi:uncharacterized protein YegL